MNFNSKEEFPATINQKWRELLDGDNHILIANILYDYVNTILDLSVRMEVLDEERYIQKQLQINKNDISNVASLFNFSYPTKIQHHNGYPLNMRLLNLGLHLFENNSRLKQEPLRMHKKISQLHEYDYLSRTIKYARNRKAHDKRIISEIGFVLNLSSSIFRLLEHCDENEYSSDILNKLRSLCFECIKQTIDFNDNANEDIKIAVDEKTNNNDDMTEVKQILNLLLMNKSQDDEEEVSENTTYIPSHLMTKQEARQKLRELAEEIKANNKTAKKLTSKQFFLSNIIIDCMLRSKIKISSRQDWEKNYDIGYRYQENIEYMKPLLDKYWHRVELILKNTDL